MKKLHVILVALLLSCAGFTTPQAMQNPGNMPDVEPPMARRFFTFVFGGLPAPRPVQDNDDWDTDEEDEIAERAAYEYIRRTENGPNRPGLLERIIERIRLMLRRPTGEPAGNRGE